MKERIHERTIVMTPSFIERGCLPRTNIKGKDPTMRVMMKLMSNGPNAASRPLTTDTIIDRNMNKALTSRALPTLVDIDFTFIILQ